MPPGLASLAIATIGASTRLSSRLSFALAQPFTRIAFAWPQVPPAAQLMWDKLDTENGYPYGKDPNPFLVSVATMLERGAVLSIGEGEGRNAVYLASLGFEVVAVDASQSALDQAKWLAYERGVKLELCCADLADFDMGEERFKAIVSIFCHLPPPLRRKVHARIVRALRPGGMFILEAFRPEQLGFGTGGPTELALLMTRDQLLSELDGLDMIRVGQVERRLDEGERHQGLCAVLEIIARKPYIHRPSGPVN